MNIKTILNRINNINYGIYEMKTGYTVKMGYENKTIYVGFSKDYEVAYYRKRAFEKEHYLPILEERKIKYDRSMYDFLKDDPYGLIGLAMLDYGDTVSNELANEVADVIALTGTKWFYGRDFPHCTYLVRNRVTKLEKELSFKEIISRINLYNAYISDKEDYELEKDLTKHNKL